MTRPPNKKKSNTVRITINPMVRLYIDDLLASGLYGSTDGEAAKKLVIDGIESAIERRLIEKRTSKD